MDYQEFLGTKHRFVRSTGIDVAADDIHGMLFPFQRDLTKWAIRKGRAAIFADTGLGKTFMQLEWARLLGERTLIVAPLSVARQTVKEARKIGLDVHYVRHAAGVNGDNPGIFITNYEMVDQFDPGLFGAVVLDESSILKALAGKTRKKLTEMFADTPYRLCCTATPAPNDVAEIANHAEFLGISTRADMLATFFVNDEGWRLKGHATENFYRWLASWGMSIRRPSDLGYDDDGFILPKLTIDPLFVKTGYRPPGQLFFTGLSGIQGRNRVRRATIEQRTEAVAEMVNGHGDQWILWCGLNDEGRKLREMIPDSVLVEGSQSLDVKIDGIEQFQDGKVRVMITKQKIAGFGMNFQNCHKMAFVGLSDSWEAYYQAIRRCWRFGQEHPVDVHIVLAEEEQAVYHNVMRKEKEATRMSEQLIENAQQYEVEEMLDQERTDWTYETDTIVDDAGWTLMLGDAAERLGEVDAESIDLSVFSPPFLSLFTYSPSERDLGNCTEPEEFFEHFGYMIDHLLRVTKTGRNCAVHVSDVPAMLARDGYIGLKDFPGMTIRAFEERGWIYHGRVAIDKNPQAQAIRTHSKALLFNQLRKDASWSRPALADYILIFRKPGENAVPIHPDITNEQWIEWAHPIWWGIDETDTLQYTTAREDKDERHVCPLQLGTIERCVRLWSNPGETVLSPFAGIGSEGYVALRHGRKFVGIELKRAYYTIAAENLKQASMEQMPLFAKLADV